MPRITLLDSGTLITQPKKILTFLTSQGVHFEKWDMDRLSEDLKGNYVLNDEDNAAIIAAFRKEIDDLNARRGYVTEDIVVLSEQTPNLEELLEKFRAEHHHADDEVRFCIDGNGTFTLKGADGRYFEVYMEPGDLISVPAGTRHWFTLNESRKIKCIRIFVSPAGWEALYEESVATK